MKEYVMNNQDRMKLVQLLEKYPQFEARIQSLVGLIENETGKFDSADDAEEYLIGEMRLLGREILQSCAEKASKKKTAEIEKIYAVKKHSKKNSLG